MSLLDGIAEMFAELDGRIRYEDRLLTSADRYLASDRAQHGRRGTYVKWGCRCEECRRAAVEDSNRYRRERKARDPEFAASIKSYNAAHSKARRKLGAPPPGEPHGLRAYSKFGCKCEVCREANRAFTAAYRKTRRARDPQWRAGQKRRTGRSAA